MSDSLGDRFVGALHELLSPVEDAVADPWWLGRLLSEIGAAPESAGGSQLAAALGQVIELVQQIEALAKNPSPSMDAIASLFDSARGVFAAVRAVSAAGGPAARLAGLGEDLVEFLVGRYLNLYHPLAVRLGVLLTLIDAAEENRPTPPTVNGTQLVRDSFAIDRFRPERLASLIEDPLSVLRAEYLNGLATASDANAMADKLFGRVARVLTALGVPWRYGLSDSDRPTFGDVAPLVDHALTIYAAQKMRGADVDAGAMLMLSAADGGDLGLVVVPFGGLTLTRQVGDWQLQSSLTADVQAFAYGRNGLTLLASGSSVDVKGSFKATLPQPADGPALLLGAPTGTRLEVGGAIVGAELALSAAQRALALSAAVSSATLVIARGDGDGFLQRVLPSDGLRATFDLALQWSNAQGLSFRGAAGLDATLPIAASFGPIAVPTMHLRLGADDGGIDAEVSATFALSIGPVRAVVDRTGLLATLAFPANGGSLGLADLALGWKPPSGIGLSVDAEAVSGGGYLGHTGDQYSGSVDLSICGVAVKAYGLIETQLPGGAAGYSALVVLSAEFSPGLQLGFGFTLDGVGGLVGINRTLSTSNVETAIWSHHFDGLLFPKDPVVAAPTLMSAIDSYFPAADGRFLFGPLAKIGWGGGIVEALVALVLELPEPIKLLLLGEIEVQLPVKLPQLVLHIDFAGGVDFGQKRAFFDASLHDSKIERYPIGGDLAFRYDWGDAPVFALAIGGFNPHYQPPASFPTLKRLSLTVGQSGLQLQAQGYFALTSNTLQLGAKVEITAGTGEINIHGFFSFDALVQWDPFAFSLELSAGVDLRSGTTTLASVHLDGQVSGTAPWHVSCDASLSLLFFDVSVHYDKQWGDTASALPAVDPTPDVLAALRDASAWSATTPPALTASVTAATSPSDAGGAVLLDPAGGVRVSQRVVPLGQPITRYAGTPLAAPLTLAIDSPNVFGETATQPADEEFALAQFEDMSDQEKLSLPSFTRLTSGITIADGAVDLGQSSRTRAVFTSIDYETTIIDTVAPPPPPPSYIFTPAMQAALHARLVGFVTPPPKLTLAVEEYVIAGTSDLKARGDIASDGSKQGALAALDRYLAANPSLRGQLQVVLAREAA